MSKEKLTVTASMVYACMLYIAESSEDFIIIAKKHPRVTSRVKEVVNLIENDKAFNSLFKIEDGDALINMFSKHLDETVEESIKALKGALFN